MKSTMLSLPFLAVVAPFFIGCGLKINDYAKSTLASAVLLSPAEGTKVTSNNRTINFSWQSVANANTYTVEVRKDGAIIATASTIQTNVPITDNGFIAKKSYEWRVRALGTGVNASTTAWANFTTADTFSKPTIPSGIQ